MSLAAAGTVRHGGAPDPRQEGFELPVFDGRVIVITGVGGRGQVGEAVARAFAEAGATLALLSGSEANARSRAAEIGSAVRIALGVDLTDAAAAHDAAARISAAIGKGVHALVALAGGFAPGAPVATSRPEHWEHMMAINVETAVNTTRAFLPALRQARGAIVYMASEAALPGSRVAGMSAYSAAKSAVLVLMRAVAEEERAHGVRANALAPGAIRTAANVGAMGVDSRFVERDAVADAVLWLSGEPARAVTGQVLHLSPGIT